MLKVGVAIGFWGRSSAEAGPRNALNCEGTAFFGSSNSTRHPHKPFFLNKSVSYQCHAGKAVYTLMYKAEQIHLYLLEIEKGLIKTKESSGAGRLTAAQSEPLRFPLMYLPCFPLLAFLCFFSDSRYHSQSMGTVTTRPSAPIYPMELGRAPAPIPNTSADEETDKAMLEKSINYTQHGLNAVDAERSAGLLKLERMTKPSMSLLTSIHAS